VFICALTLYIYSSSYQFYNCLVISYNNDFLYLDGYVECLVCVFMRYMEFKLSMNM
jgi:hypothetical protein